jgi:hypothetical protein
MFGRHPTQTETAEAEDTGRVVHSRRTEDEDPYDPRRDPGREVTGAELQRDRFGGTNWGAAFFGWLVAVAVTVLLTGLVGAAAAAVGRENDLTTDQLADNAGTTGIAAAVTVLVILVLAYYTGGYVAGRMSRFDGGRQGLATWLLGLLATVVAVGVGVAFGSQYDVLDRVDLPSLSVPTEEVGMGGLVAAAAILLGTLLAALAGGKVGRRYHRRVDRVAERA